MMRRESVRLYVHGLGGGEHPMQTQTSLIIESNGKNLDKLNQLLEEGWKVHMVTANHGRSYNDFLVILQKDSAKQ
jgi:hypothetical protein